MMMPINGWKGYGTSLSRRSKEEGKGRGKEGVLIGLTTPVT